MKSSHCFQTPDHQNSTSLKRNKHSFSSSYQQLQSIRNKAKLEYQKHVIDEPCIIDKLNQISRKSWKKQDIVSSKKNILQVQVKQLKRQRNKWDNNSLSYHANGFKFSQKQNFFGIESIAQNTQNFRQKYKKIKLKLEKYLKQIQITQNTSVSDISVYQQEILSLFLNDFINENKKQCIDKGNLLQFIWQSLFAIIGRMMKMIVKNSNQHEKKTLKQIILNHKQYQKTIQDLKHKYEDATRKLQLNEKYTKSLVKNMRFKKREVKKLYNGIKYCQKNFSETRQEYLHLQSQHIDLLMENSQLDLAQAKQLIERKRLALIQREVKTISKFKPKNIRRQIELELKNEGQMASNNVQKSMKQKFCQTFEAFEKQCVNQQTSNQIFKTFLNSFNFEQILDGAESSCKNVLIPQTQMQPQTYNELNVCTSTCDLQWGADFNGQTTYNEKLIYDVIANRGTQTLEKKKIRKVDIEIQANDTQIRRAVVPYQITKVYQCNLLLKQYREERRSIANKLQQRQSRISPQSNQKLSRQQVQALSAFSQVLNKQRQNRKSKENGLQKKKISSFMLKDSQPILNQPQINQENSQKLKQIHQVSQFSKRKQMRKPKRPKSKIYHSRQNSGAIKKYQNTVSIHQATPDFKAQDQVNFYTQSAKKNIITGNILKQQLKKGGFLDDQQQKNNQYLNYQFNENQSKNRQIVQSKQNKKRRQIRLMTKMQSENFHILGNQHYQVDSRIKNYYNQGISPLTQQFDSNRVKQVLQKIENNKGNRFSGRKSDINFERSLLTSESGQIYSQSINQIIKKYVKSQQNQEFLKHQQLAHKNISCMLKPIQEDIKKYLHEYFNKNVKKMPISNYKGIIKSLSHVFSISYKLLQKQQPLSNLIAPLLQHFKLAYGALKPNQLYSRMISFLGQIYLHRNQSTIFECFLFFLGFSESEKTRFSQNNQTRDSHPSYEGFRTSRQENLAKQVQVTDLHFFLKLINQLSVNSNLDLQQFKTTKKVIEEKLPSFLKNQGISQALSQKIFCFLMSKVNCLLNNIKIKSSMDINLDVFKCAKNIVQFIICLKRDIMKTYFSMSFAINSKNSQCKMRQITDIPIQQALISEKLVMFLIECQFNQKLVQVTKKSYLAQSVEVSNGGFIECKKAASYLLRFQIPQLAQLYFLAINKFKLREKTLKAMSPNIQSYINNKLKFGNRKDSDELIQSLSRFNSQSFNDKKIQTLVFLNTFDKEATQLLQYIIGQQTSLLYCIGIFTLLK